MGGREASLAAEVTEAEQVRRIEQFRSELQRIVGERDDISLKINGGCVEATVDDLQFLSYEFTIPKTKEHYMLVSLLGRCSSCGVLTRSKPFANLPSLGKMLEKFEPSYEHFCRSIQRGKADE
jgi:hypothetical protein